MACPVQFVINPGGRFNQLIQLRDSGDIDANPIPIPAGYTAIGELRRRPGTPLRVDLEPLITDFPNGEIEFDVEIPVTLAPGIYQYDVLILDLSGAIWLNAAPEARVLVRSTVTELAVA